MGEVGRSDNETLRAEIARLRWMVALLAVALAVCTLWLALRSPPLPAVLAAERLEIREPDGNLAFVLANSVRPVPATMDGQVIMEGQEEERMGVPSFIFFDGKGDEVGGLTTGVRTSPDGYSAVRHLSLDGYKQDQTVVLAHYQSPDGYSAGLRISDRPEDLSILEAFGELGLEPGTSREEMQAAIEAIPEEDRARRLREWFGASRLFVGTGRDRSAALILHDGVGRPRIRIEAPAEGEPSIQILDESGEPVARIPSS